MSINKKTEIIKYSLKEPNANIMIFKNIIIHNNVITINTELKSEQQILPTMYQSWTNNQISC